MECGYCGATVEEAPDGYRHTEDPRVPLVHAPGDYATPGHRAGTRVNPVDIVDGTVSNV
jgi:hypothetical protein